MKWLDRVLIVYLAVGLWVMLYLMFGMLLVYLMTGWLP